MFINILNKMQYNRSITEAKAIDLLNEKYGTNDIERFSKLIEEFKEFKEAFENYFNDTNDKELALAKLIDEGSDVYIILTQFMSKYGIYHRELLDMAINKIKGREIDPNYKRT